MRHLIPFSALRPHIERYLKAQLNDAGLEELDIYGPEVQALAERAGVHPDTISKPFQGVRVSVSFDNADRIVAAMGNTMIWHDDPVLAELYWPKGKPPNPMLPVKCRNPKCDAWLPLEEIPTTGSVTGATKYRKTIYCDDNCKGAAYRSKGRAHNRSVKKYRQRNRAAYNAYMRDYRARKAAERRGLVTA